MAGAWLWAAALLPAGVGGALLLSPERRAGAAAGPLAVATTAGALLLAVWAWAARPASEVAWLPYGAGEAITLKLSAAAQAAPLALLVAAVALLVMAYAVGYMAHDRARARFFGFMALFVGAMELLVLADGLLTLLLAWELVGLCSYALIGFWHRDPERVVAANRAFLATRSADLGLYLAAMAAFAGAGTFALDALAGLPAPYRDVAAAGLIVAAAGKSAQLPFSGWLSGAMLGPSPVSALLHSATMVAAGAVLLIKVLPLLEATGWATAVVLWLGVATAVASALIALFQDELKQVTAASTISQYGYVFAAIGAGAVAPAAAHLANHAAFKALLFMVAGVLLHQGLRYLRDMGGLRRALPVQATLFALGALALAAVPPMGGFFSKEALLAGLKEASGLAWALLLLAALLTAAYAARAWLGAFAGPARSEKVREAHEPGPLLTAPSALLALAALLLAALALPPLKHRWSAALDAAPMPAFAYVEAAVALALALAGIASAWLLHRRGRLAPMAPLLGAAGSRAAVDWFGLIRLLDATGQAVLGAARVVDRLDRTEPATRVGSAALGTARALGRLDRTEPATRLGHAVAALARAVGGFDDRAVDAATARASGLLARSLAALSLATDRRVWEGAIQRLDSGLQATAGGLGRLQSGLLHQYYALAAAGVAVLFAYAFLVFGG